MKKEIAVNITQQAVDKAKELINLDSSSIGLRIDIKKGGCSGMTYDVVHAKSFNEQDEVIKKAKLDDKIASYLKNTTIIKEIYIKGKILNIVLKQ